MTHYRLLLGQDEKGPYTVEQLQAMWASGMVTADAHYWTEGMEAWRPIEDLRLGAAPQRVDQPILYSPPPLPTQPKSHHIHHSGQVSTKAKGSGVVALGTVLCIVGIFVAMGSAVHPAFGAIGGLLLVGGFFVAVIGRLIS